MKFYEAAKGVLILALLAGLAAAAGLAAWKTLAIGNAIESEVWQLGPRLERQIALQGDRTREMVVAISGDIAKRLDGQVSALRKDLRGAAHEFGKVTDTRLAAIQDDAREQIVELRLAAAGELSQANSNIARLATFAEVQPLVKGILGDFAQTSKLMFDCKASPRTCMAPRFAGTFRAIELASGDLSKAMKVVPQFVVTAQQTNGHIERYVDRFTRPKSTGAQIRDVGLTLAGFGWKVAMRD